MLIIYLPRRNRNGCVPSLEGGGGAVGVGEATARCLLATYYNIYLIFISNFFLWRHEAYEIATQTLRRAGKKLLHNQQAAHSESCCGQKSRLAGRGGGGGRAGICRWLKLYALRR